MTQNFTCVSSLVSDGNMSSRRERENEGWRATDAMQRFVKAQGLSPDAVVLMSLPEPFGDSIEEVKIDAGWSHDAWWRKLACADALITRDPSVTLALLTADCVPVAFYAPDIGAIALAHCGRQSTHVQLAEKVVVRLVELGAQPIHMRVHMGPCIKKESYVFDSENLLQADDAAWQPHIETSSDGKLHVDLVGYNSAQLTEAGVLPENIAVSHVDTFVDCNYFSHRRSLQKGEPEGRFVTVVKMV